MYCAVASFVTNSISATYVQFRAGSSTRESGGTLHPAAEIILNPLYDDYNIDFDVAVVRVSDNDFVFPTFSQNQFKQSSNTLNERLNLV
jgi:hypothetical protein